ncbi:TIGR01620 family protein [Paraferrimonas sedimenticola]|uniref:TIGR01620 family protein n=1 Tax=Paraferrimonas sedimenticola TaxID=375674 RepID=A0AA37RRL6_9GAMM|nr:TIGR01620 family protein [Paraferrimonas sedimenticola]GLP94833.1 hypothetical protein GCM10007895_01390 [Paraferrimonas sedimenticola]
MSQPQKPLRFDIEPQAKVETQTASRFDDAVVGQLEPEHPITPLQIDDPLETQAPPKRRRGLKLLLLLIACVLGVELVDTLMQAWQTSPWRFGLYASAVGLALGLAGRAAWREWRLLRQLKQVEQNQGAAQRMQTSVQHGEVSDWLAKQPLSKVYPKAYQRFGELVQPHHNDAEQLALFEKVVLHEADERAQKQVARFAGEAALLLAASPLAALDMALILWRNQRMIDQVAQSYGVKLGYASRLRLVRGIVRNIIYAGASEIATDVGSQFVSAELSGKLSARVAQGLGGGLLTARLGHKAMALCRPVEFSSESRPKMTQVQAKLLTQLGELAGQGFKAERASKQKVKANKVDS